MQIAGRDSACRLLEIFFFPSGFRIFFFRPHAFPKAFSFSLSLYSSVSYCFFSPPIVRDELNPSTYIQKKKTPPVKSRSNRS